jgi:hypothetical protein
VAKESNLIYALCESAISDPAQVPTHIFVLNRELKQKNKSGGLVFVLNMQATLLPQARPLSIYLPTYLPGKLSIPVRITPLNQEAEKFCMENHLMPSGFLLNVTQYSVQLWNFDEE